MRFGPFEFCPKSQEIWKRGVRLKLRRQPMAVLQILLENSGEVVTREELQKRLWASDTFVDFEHGLNTAVKELRGVLGDSATEPRYIETLPRVGYRMVVAAEMVPEEDKRNSGQVPVAERLRETAANAETQAQTGPPLAQSQPTRRLFGQFLLAGLAVLLGVLGYAGYRRWAGPREAAGAASGGKIMLAVMPFENLTGDSGQDYFSDGLTEEMIAQLGWLDPQRLGVITGPPASRTKSGGDAGQIGKQLGAQYVLQGSVRRDAEKIRVTAKLIQTRDQTHVWSKEYDRDISNLLALQSEIAREIAGEIRLTLDQRGKGVTSAALSSKEVEAHDLYLRGRYFWNKRTAEGFRRAAEYFQQAVERDPSYARAYAGLADCYTLMSSYAITPAKETMPKARAASKRALELDDRLAEAHTSAALVAEIYDWDWKKAEAEFRRAIELNPNYATAHHWYAECLAWQGRFDEAFQEIELARQLDPLSLIILADRAVFHYFAHRYDEAIAEFQGVVEMEPEFPRTPMLALALAQKGRYPEALELVEKQASTEYNSWPEVLRAYLNGRAGNQKAAEEALARLQRQRPVTAYQLAVAEMGTGDKEMAIAQLEKAFVDRSISMEVHVDPIFDPLRGDERFQKIEKGMGLR
jgi:TolB-like protein/DNA-binding winged helix-turn-helix (wHTH) protein/Tfp pilus assembly protein PilF